ncbi:hypothetical protein K461DRAFT_322380 [Myriangium duriaei CBS 260.36]|uniref:Uncharacterized protein n=1 Tax=Myriangium duriaei CBS 260.36 TaxID=1168546 RepID=A0A9P4J285_9PEZI|nr:hypothetical protein K461DRAFT_322380 [Myriangium duriaei CBS 260.36]
MSSPSEFLTFYRRVGTTATSAMRAHRVLPRPAAPARAITYSAVRTIKSTDIGEGKKHATQKNERLDVQSDNAGAGQDAKKTGSGGQATSQKDSRDNVSRAKQDHPEAPDTAIGFQDERGSKGH